MDKKTIFVVFLAMIVAVAALFIAAERSLAPKPGAANGLKCAVENCHGLDIQCGANSPEVCTDIYELGDRCLRYAKCGIVSGQCQQIGNRQFDACKSCVQGCSASFQNDQPGLFGCESQCAADTNGGTPADSTVLPGSAGATGSAAPTDSGAIVAGRKAIEMAFPAFFDFEKQPSLAGREVKTQSEDSVYYFAYIEYGSGVPIAKATCFKVDAALKATQVGAFPNSATPVGIYTAIDPLTCNGIK